MATQTDFTGEEGPHGTKVLRQAPSPEELAAKFPELEIIELIGRGGMGAVYKARQKELDRIVALKILPPGIGETPGFAGRFTREAKALAKLNHTNIVTLYEFGRTDGLFFFLMEYVDGVNLRQLLASGRIAPREALAIVPQICDALQYAHDQGIVHRDIKPDNILMDRRGRVKVADFGLAKIVSEAVGSGSAEGAEAQTSGATPAAREFTEAGKVMGTPQYMAPEQADHPTEVDHRADIYALGVVFYQMLTGELPGKQIEAPSKKVHIDVRLDEIVLRALEKKPELRYQQASVMKTEVETIATNPPNSASDPSEPSENHSDKSGASVSSIRTMLDVPSLGMIVISSLSLLLLAVTIPLWVYGAFLGVAGKPVDLPWAFGIPVAMVMVGFNIVSLTGARRMRQLRDHTLAVVGSILFILTPGLGLAVAKACNVSPNASAGFSVLLAFLLGIWSLIVLSRRDVREAFGENKGAAPLAACEATRPEQPPASAASYSPWEPAITVVGTILIIVLMIVASGRPPEIGWPLFAILMIGLIICGLTLAGIWPVPSPWFPKPNFSSRNLRRGNTGEPPKGESRDERRRRKMLRYGFITSLIGLLIGIALSLPLVWGLSLAGIVIGALKLAAIDREGPATEPLENKQQKPATPEGTKTPGQPHLSRTAIPSSGVRRFGWLPVAGLIALVALILAGAFLNVMVRKHNQMEANVESFGPLIELQVEGGIDFDSGMRTPLPLPQPLGDTDSARYDWFNGEESGPWMRQHGIDAVNGNHALMSKGLMLVKLEKKDWDTLSPDKLRQRILDQALASDSFTEGGSRTFGFKTHEGGIGIVQMLEDRYAPGITNTKLPGVKIRYKLLRNNSDEPGLKPKTEFAAKLPDGSFVELVSLMYGSNPRRAKGQTNEIEWFWNPDGKPPEENIGWSFGAGNLSSTRDLSLDYRRFVVRWGGPDTNNVRLVSWQLGENPQDSAEGQFPVTPKGESAENWIGLTQGFPREKETTTIRFALASGPYLTGPKPGFDWSSSDRTPYGSYSIGDIFDHNGNAAVTLAHNLKGCDYRLRITIDTAPKPKSAIGGLIWEWKQDHRRGERYQPVYGWVVKGGAFNQTFEFPGVPAREAMTRLPSIDFEVRPVNWVEFQNVALNPGEQTRVQIRVSHAGEELPAMDDVATFGPVLERVLPDPDNGGGRGNRETLRLRTGERLSVLDEAPKEQGGRLRALVASKGDLFAEYDDFVGQRWTLVTAGLKLSDFLTRQWELATPKDLTEALEQPSALQRVEHSGATLYLLPEGLLPITFALESKEGERGLLQITALNDNPRTVTIRYKLVQSGSSAPGGNHTGAAAQESSQTAPAVPNSYVAAAIAGLDVAVEQIKQAAAKRELSQLADLFNHVNELCDQFQGKNQNPATTARDWGIENPDNFRKLMKIVASLENDAEGMRSVARGDAGTKGERNEMLQQVSERFLQSYEQFKVLLR